MELTLWQAAILGLVEGITEYLPVSSTGHLILAGALMGLGDTPAKQQAVDTFAIVIQGGAIAAVAYLYWPSLMRMLAGLRGRDEQGLRLFINICIAFLPAAVIGKLFKDQIERYLFSPVPVLIALGLGGIYMMIADLRAQGRIGRTPQHSGGATEVMNLTPGQALFIGLLQCVAMWPGTSRSMMTITGGIWCGMKPRAAAEFSFLLGLPTLLAATLYKLAGNLYKSHQEGTPNMFEVLGYGACAVGIIVAAVSAAIAVKWLVGFLNRNGLTPFAWYRLALCFVMAGLVFSGKLTFHPPGGTDSKVEKAAGSQGVNSQTTRVEDLRWDSPAEKQAK
jgi:undecaprenyl-diphosphatase